LRLEINIDATRIWGDEVEASSVDAVWDENPELSKEIDELLAKLSDLYMVTDVLVEESSQMSDEKIDEMLAEQRAWRKTILEARGEEVY